MIVIICGRHKKNPSRTVDATERKRTYPLMIVIICGKYKKNPYRTVDATEWNRFSKSRPIDLEDIGQGQGSSHATHPLMLLIICTQYGKNPS